MKEKTAMVDEERAVFALDIGTRSVIGIVGFQDGDYFRVSCVETEEYQKRAVVDGQIEDIGETAKIAGRVKERLEKRLGFALKSVHIAAAGRVLRTREASFEMETGGGLITPEFVAKLEFEAIQRAYSALMEEEENQGMDFLSVGHSVRSYTVDGYEFSNLLDHQGRVAGVSVIATFLPREVVESLYTTMRQIGLTVAALTLEPIAAMNAVIPDDLRKLNLALVDIGAGTSDIALCERGGVSAYTMATVAGDEITEALMQGCLVDFAAAEEIKHTLSEKLKKKIAYEDILGLPHEESEEELFEKIRPAVENLAQVISERILEVNGKAPSAVFLAGGGSQTPGLAPLVAQGLSMDVSRVAVGGNNYMKRMIVTEEPVFGPEYATPVGIALTAVRQGAGDAAAVTVNGERRRLVNSWNSTVLGVLQMGGVRYDQLLGRTGKNVSYTLDGRRVVARGQLPEEAVITLNGEPASLQSPVRPGDSLEFKPAQPGADAAVYLRDLSAEGETFPVFLGGVEVTAGQTFLVNGSPAGPERRIESRDELVSRRVESLADLCAVHGLDPVGKTFVVGGAAQPLSYRLKPGDEVAMANASVHEAPLRPQQAQQTPFRPAPAQPAFSSAPAAPQRVRIPSAAAPVPPAPAAAEAAPRQAGPLRVLLNGQEVVFPQRDAPYEFFNLLAYTDIDPKNPQGQIVQLLNGRPASYTAVLKDGDRAEIFWDKS
ncbi:MAG: cell division protein FtsA [Oscillospiraceae bacterium]|nr:cell division protein FtsA [Oscillospiraceae bacterium]